MENKEEKALQSALAEIRSRPPVGRRRRPHDFSSVVRTLFLEISELRPSWKHQIPSVLSMKISGSKAPLTATKTV